MKDILLKQDLMAESIPGSNRECLPGMVLIMTQLVEVISNPGEEEHHPDADN